MKLVLCQAMTPVPWPIPEQADCDRSQAYDQEGYAHSSPFIRSANESAPRLVRLHCSMLGSIPRNPVNHSLRRYRASTRLMALSRVRNPQAKPQESGGPKPAASLLYRLVIPSD